MRFSAYFLTLSVIALTSPCLAQNSEISRADLRALTIQDPLLDNYTAKATNECLADPTEAELAEARDKFQKWVNTKLPNAKDTAEISKEIMTKFDSNGDKKITSTELGSLLEEADIGNWITRGCWATGIIDHFEKESSDDNKDKALTEEEISAGLKKLGITAPPPPPPPPAS